MMNRTRPAVFAAALVAGGLLLSACADDGTELDPGVYTLTVSFDSIGTGTVTSAPAGLTCDGTAATCSAEFDGGTTVTLTATPAEGMAFVAWSGAATGASTTATVTMEADRSVTAAFDDPDVAMQQVGAEGGTVASRDGTLTLEIPAGALTAATAITIERVDPADLGEDWADVQENLDHAYEMGPDGQTFEVPVMVSLAGPAVTWSGDTAAVHIPRLATTGEAANQALDSLALEVDMATGSTVVQGWLTHFSPFTVQTTPVGSMAAFSATSPPDQATLGEEFKVFVVADPDISPFELTVALGPKSAGIELVSSEEGLLGVGRELTLRCTTPGTVTVSVSAVAQDPMILGSRSATFTTTMECLGFALSVTTTGAGSGTVTSAPDGIVCGTLGSVCAADFGAGATVTLTATPDEGSYVVGCTEHTEADPEVTTDCVVTMDAAEEVTVEFGIQPSNTFTMEMTGEDGTATGPGIDCKREGGVTSGDCETDAAGTMTVTTRTPNGSIVTDYDDGHGGTINASGALEVEMTEDRHVSVRIPTVPQLAAFMTLQSIQYLEALTLMHVLFPFLFEDPVEAPADGLSPVAFAAAMAEEPTGEACPTMLGAASERAVAFDACTGEILQEYPFAGESFYDAIALVPPTGYDGLHQILMTGQNWVHCYIEDDGTGNDACLGSPSFNNIQDAQPIDPKDPTAGALFADGIGQIRFIVFAPSKGYFDSHPDRFGGLPGAMVSAVAGIPAEDPTTPPNESLAIGWRWNEEFTGKIGQLIHVEMYPADSESAVGTVVADLPGDNPRRIRCDLTSGICAISDFNNDHVTILTWTGTGMPVVAETTAPGEVADGPVGLDVFGNLIVTAGFNDDHYTIIEVDAAGAVVSTTSTPLPAGCTQPGHAMFLEDGGNTIIVSCWGSGGYAYIPGAF